MAIDVSVVLVSPTVPQQDLSIRFPGGLELSAQTVTAGIPDPMEVVQGLLNQINTALAPLNPVFNVIDGILAIFEFAKAVPTLNPITITDKLTDIGTAVGKLLSLVPQLSVPLLILDIIDALLALLTAMQRQLLTQVLQAQRLAASGLKATQLGSVQLQLVVDQGNQNLSLQMQSMNEGMTPINRLISILNVFTSLVPGLPPIPTFDNLGDNAAEALVSIGNAIELLQSIRNLIPV